MDTPLDTATGEPGRSPPLDRSARRPLSLAGAFGDAWHELRALVRDHAALAVLEAQRAGIRFAVLVAIALAVGVLAVTAWLTLVTALAVWLLGEGMSWPTVLVSAAILNVLIAAVLLWVARSRVAEVPFPATLRQLSEDRDELDPTR